MTFLIGSDIHGSLTYAKMFFEIAEKTKPSKIVLLGDHYYNGARNDPPEGYAPKAVVTLLNSYAERLIALKGNCESEVDQTVSQFPIVEMAYLYAFGKEIVLAHGHHASMDNLPLGHYDIFIQGHTHVSVLERRGNLIVANPGSLSLPKDSHHSYLWLDDKGLKLYDLIDGSLLKKLDF
jgi:putative phosphoesterase